MKTGFFILTFNRPQVLNSCINSLFSNTNLSPTEVWIVDDGSENNIKQSLLNLSNKAKRFPINLIIHGLNYGIGYGFERVYNLLRQNDDLDIACIIESDYVWRKNWLEDCQEVFNSCPETIAIAGTDHPDMYDLEKTQIVFPKIMSDFYKNDLESRKYLYKPFSISTKNSQIQIQGVSNSCGCIIVHLKRLKTILNKLEKEKIIDINYFWNQIDLACHKNVSHDTRKNFSDALMSCTISRIGELYLKKQAKDISTNFPMVSICDYSISQHVCGGGINGKTVPEGSTFILSPKWDDKYLTENPR